MTFSKNFFLCVVSVTVTISAQTSLSKKYLTPKEALANKDTAQAVVMLEDSTKHNKGAAYNYELAKILSVHKTHSVLTDAIKYSRRAVELDEKNIPYRLLLARIREDLFNASFLNLEERSAAQMEYENILKIDSTCTEALSNLGRLNGEDYHKFKNSVEIDQKYTEVGGPNKSPDVVNDLYRAHELFFQKFDTTPKLSWEKNLTSLSKDAENYFAKAISLQPDNFDNYSLLAKLCVERGEPAELIPYFVKYISKHRENKDAHMFLGLAYYMVHENEKANKEFQNAMMYSTQQEIDELKISTTRLLLEPTMGEKFGTMSPEEISTTVLGYWNYNDPLLLTTYNEGILEHYSRVAYANLFFSVPKMNLVGWKTERGETLIRYGQPEQKIKLRAPFSPGSDQPMAEIWVYAEKIFQFVDEYRNTNYTLLSPKSGKSYFFPTASYDAFLSYKTIKPREYQPTYDGPSFNLPLAKYQLKGINGATDTYLTYAIDESDSLTLLDKFSQGFDLGIYLFDRKFTSKFKRKTTVENVNGFAKFHDDKKEFLVASNSFAAEPTSGSLAFEMIRKKDKGVFSSHSKFDVKRFANNDLCLSDIITCVDITVGEKKDSYINRGDIYFLPNPTKTFSNKIPLFLYYEVYNLSLDDRSQTNFTQEITIRKKEEEGLGNILNSIGDVIGIGKKGEKISLTSNFQTEEKEPQIYLQLDMNKYEPGNYIISITIKDKLSGKSVSADSEIIWQ